MAGADVIFQDVFKCYVLPISALLLLIGLLKNYLRRLHGKVRSRVSLRISDIYDQATCKHKQKLFAPLKQLSQSVNRPLRMLELSVGLGNNFKYYPGGCDVVCLDRDASYEDYIQNKACYDYPHIRVLDFVVGGGEVLCGLPDACLDVVIITHALCDEVDPVKTVREIFRILIPGGRFYFVDHTQAPRWSSTYFIQLLVKPVYSVLRTGCDIRRDLMEIVLKCPFQRIDNETFWLRLNERSSFVDRLLVPIWLRTHITGAATK